MDRDIRTASASDRMIKSSVQKVNLVVDIIRGENALAAMTQLDFCKRYVAQPIKKVLNSAISNSQNNMDLDIDRLYVSEVRVGK